jgi:hypothetical protein
LWLAIGSLGIVLKTKNLYQKTKMQLLLQKTLKRVVEKEFKRLTLLLNWQLPYRCIPELCVALQVAARL